MPALMHVVITMMLLVLSMSAPVSAQQLVETHRNWRVFTAEQGGEKLCYIGSLPIKKEGNYSKRGKAYVLVTHRGGNQDEISVSSGYPYKEGKDVTLQFGQKNYDLFTKGELAWAYDAKADRAIIKEMIKGSDMVVRGTSWKSTTSKDTYSLLGFTDAHRTMKKACE